MTDKFSNDTHPNTTEELARQYAEQKRAGLHEMPQHYGWSKARPGTPEVREGGTYRYNTGGTSQDVGVQSATVGKPDQDLVTVGNTEFTPQDGLNAGLLEYDEHGQLQLTEEGLAYADELDQAKTSEDQPEDDELEVQEAIETFDKTLDALERNLPPEITDAAADVGLNEGTPEALVEAGIPQEAVDNLVAGYTANVDAIGREAGIANASALMTDFLGEGEKLEARRAVMSNDKTQIASYVQRAAANIENNSEMVQGLLEDAQQVGIRTDVRGGIPYIEIGQHGFIRLSTAIREGHVILDS